MGKTIANVLVGTATLSIRQPDDAIAEWSEPGYGGESQSAKLLKTGSGNAGSTHIQFTPPAGITLSTITWADYGFWHLAQAMAGPVNWCQMEFRFEDPNSPAWVELTAMPCQSEAGTGLWAEEDLVDGTDSVFCGLGEAGVGFSDFGIDSLIDNSDTEIKAEVAVTDPDDWVLTRIRVELWEPEPARYVYVGEVEIAGVSYTVSPGGTAPGMSLGSPHIEVGYTEDGVTMEYAAEQFDIVVHEETFPIGSALTAESLSITCNMAEASLANMNNAMAGAVLSGSKITLGAGVNKTMNLKIEGINPAGLLRAIYIPSAVAGGTVGMSYKKGEKTIVPITFKALKGDSPACTIVDNTA